MLIAEMRGQTMAEERFTCEARGKVWVGVDQLTGGRCPHRHRNPFYARDCLSPGGVAHLHFRVLAALDDVSNVFGGNGHGVQLVRADRNGAVYRVRSAEKVRDGS